MWILIAVLGLLLLIVLFLSIPFNLLLYLSIQEDFVFKMKLRWLFGLARFNIEPGKKEVGKETAKKTGKVKRDKSFSFELLSKIARIEGLPRQFARLIKDIFHAVRVKSLSLDLKIGLEDPAQNAYIYACAVPANYLFKYTPYQINIQPVFENELVLECLSDCNIMVIPAEIIGCVFKNVFSGPALKAIGTVIKNKWTINK